MTIPGLINRLKSNLVIMGVGMDKAVLKRNRKSSNYLIQQTGKAPISNFTMIGLNIEGIIDHHYSLVQFKDCTRLTFRDIKFKNAPSSEEENGRSTLLRIDNNEPSLNWESHKIIGCQFESFFYGIYARPYNGGYGGNIDIQNCIFRNSGTGHQSSGVLLGSEGSGNMGNVNIVDSHFQDLDDTGIMIVGSNVKFSNIHISGNIMDTYRVGIWIDAHSKKPADNISISRNTISSTIDKGIYIENANNFIIENNVTYSCGFTGISLYDVHHGVIKGNYLINNGRLKKDGYSDGMRISSLLGKGSENLSVSNNYFKNNSQNSLAITAYSDFINIENNYFNDKDTTEINNLFIPLAQERHKNIVIKNNGQFVKRIEVTSQEPVDIDFVSHQQVILDINVQRLTLGKINSLYQTDQQGILIIQNRTQRDIEIDWGQNIMPVSILAEKLPSKEKLSMLFKPDQNLYLIEE
jgi:parallel beta-helix repeat protein